MTCTTNGRLSAEQRPARWRVAQEVVSPGGGAIDIDWTAPADVFLEQITMAWNIAPTTSEEFTLVRDAIDGTNYDCVFRQEDPSLAPWRFWVCVTGFRFDTGDIVRFDYANTDDRTIGVVMWFRQVDN